MLFIMAFVFACSFCEAAPSISIYAVNTSTGEVLIDKNSDLSLIPASSLKVVTTAAALHLLKPETKLATVLEYDGYLDEKGVLQGNIYVKGGGDPCLGSARIKNGGWRQQLDRWIEAIFSLGIKHIRGNIIADVSIWENALSVPSWSWEDLGNYYGAGASALSFHENMYHLFLKPGSSLGAPVEIVRTDPPITHFQLYNELKTGPENSGDCACIYGMEYSPVAFIKGTIPLGGEFKIKGSMPNPSQSCVELLAKRLQDTGISIELQQGFSKERHLFHTTLSPSVAEIVYWTNQNSVNLYAEHLLKKMGQVIYQDGSTTGGIKAVKFYLNSQKIDLDGFNMVDGSGLSRKNLITTKQLVMILSKAKTAEYFPELIKSLPLLDDQNQESQIYAKSGSMSLIRSYVGIKGDIVFAIIANNLTELKFFQRAKEDLIERLR